MKQYTTKEISAKFHTDRQRAIFKKDKVLAIAIEEFGNESWIKVSDIIDRMLSMEKESERNPNMLITYRSMWNGLKRELQGLKK